MAGLEQSSFMFPKVRMMLGCLAGAAWLLGASGVGWAAERFVAYQVQGGTVGNQAFGGTLGMDFEVANPVLVTRIGVFDDGGDGLNLPITASLWDRSDPEAPVLLLTVEFTPEEPGTLEGGSRFKVLPEPMRLEIGFQGTIVAEGYGEGERLRNAGAVDATWTLNDGNGSLAFVGTSRYGVVNGEYPDVPDAGPEARYAAGTFEFEVTPPVKPGVPTGVRLVPGDGRMSLTWNEVTAPVAAAKYEIWRAASPTADFTKLGEATATEYADTGLPNGTTYCYKVRGIGPAGQEGVESARFCGAPYVLPADQRVAYLVDAGIAGTQNFGGTLGMDFEVVNPVVITHLGVFDEGGDGLARVLTARLWDRSDAELPVELASLDFTPEDPGVLIGGSRYKALATPVRLENGFRGTISAENYGPEERLVNPGGSLTVARPWVVDSASGSIRFVGSGRYSVNPGEFPATPDGGVPDRYGAGSFQYQATPLVYPGTPTLRAAHGDLSVVLDWTVAAEPVPSAKYRVSRRVDDGVAGQVAEVTEAGYTDTGVTKGQRACYTVVAVSEAGQAGGASAEVCLVVEAREAGVAYLVEAGTVGNQNFGGALGMHFDVLRAVRITRLGVFDDSSDGLFLPITARLYDRATGQVLAEVLFTPEEPGELIGGSRFKDLAEPRVLSAGFQGTIATAGYGDDERNGNGIAGRSLFTGGGSLAFVGTGAYAVDPTAYPATADAGPANRYAAGTFHFEPAAEPPLVRVGRVAGKVKLEWTGGGTLETAPAVTGEWVPVPGAASGIELDATGAGAFYRVRQ